MLTLVLHVAFGCPDLGGGYPGVAPWPRTLLLAPTVWGGWGEVVDRVHSTRALMIGVAPYIPGSRWVPSMVSMAQGPHLFIPVWSGILTQAGGVLCGGPQLRGCRLGAWLR